MKETVRFHVNKSGFFAKAAMVCLLLSILFRLIGTVRNWNDSTFAIFQIIVPAAACLFLAFCINPLGNGAFFLSAVPVLAGGVFFCARELVKVPGSVMDTVKLVAFIVAVIAVVILYCAVVFNIIRKKWFLIPLFILALACEVWFVIRPAFTEALGAFEAFQDLSTVFMLLAMTAVSCALTNKKPAEASPVVETPVVQDAPADVQVIAAEPVPEDTFTAQADAADESVPAAAYEPAEEASLCVQPPVEESFCEATAEEPEVAGCCAEEPVLQPEAEAPAEVPEQIYAAEEPAPVAVFTPEAPAETLPEEDFAEAPAPAAERCVIPEEPSVPDSVIGGLKSLFSKIGTKEKGNK